MDQTSTLAKLRTVLAWLAIVAGFGLEIAQAVAEVAPEIRGLFPDSRGWGAVILIAGIVLRVARRRPADGRAAGAGAPGAPPAPVPAPAPTRPDGLPRLLPLLLATALLLPAAGCLRAEVHATALQLQADAAKLERDMRIFAAATIPDPRYGPEERAAVDGLEREIVESVQAVSRTAQVLERESR